MKKIIVKTIVPFGIIYLLGQLYTFLLSSNIPNNLINFGNYNFSTIITYFFQFIYIIFVIYFFKIFKIPNNLIIDKRKNFSKFILSFFLLYSSLSVFSSINKSSNTQDFHFSFNWDNWDGTKNLFIIIVILGPIFEELFFRQVLLKPFLKDKKTTWIGVAITTFLFAMSHFYVINYHLNINYHYFLEMLIFGFILTLIRIRFGLIFSITTHIIYNFIVILYKENITNLFYLDYINNEYLFWFLQILTIIFVTLSIIYITKFETNK